MKKALSAGLILLAAFWLVPVALTAGKPFEGVITYKITYPDAKVSESQLAMFPKLITISVKGNKSRTDMNMGGMNTVEIIDYKDKTSVSLLNFMGQKYALKMTTADIEKKASSKGTPSVELLSETKVIAGYTCKKAVVTMNDDGVKSTYEVYYCPELGSKMINFSDPVYKDIDGALMEFSTSEQGMTMKFTATSIEKKNLSEKDFEVPSDYTVTTEEELKSKFGGGNE